MRLPFNNGMYSVELPWTVKFTGFIFKIAVPENEFDTEKHFQVFLSIKKKEPSPFRHDFQLQELFGVVGDAKLRENSVQCVAL